MNALQGIFTNAVALNAQRNLGVSQNSLAGIQAQLSSGLRINGARDDAAGLAISDRLQANLKAQDSSIRSINEGISLVQVADGGLMNISESLQRGFELAVQAANGTLAASDRANLNAEFRQLHAEIDRIAEGTEIFGRYPLAATPPTTMGQTKSIKEVFAGGPTLNGQPSGLKPIGFIPAGATDVTITVDGIVGAEDDIQIFTADGKHLLTDVWTSAGVVAGVGLVALTGIDRLDPIVALLVGLNIIWTGWRLMQESAHGLMDAALPEEENIRVSQILARFATDEVAFHGLRTRASGHRAFADVHVLVPGTWTVARGHDLVEDIEAALAHEVPDLTLSTHVEPSEDPRSYDDFEAEFPVPPPGINPDRPAP